MQKIILITGATDGIGLEAAKLLAAQGHHLLLHGRDPVKLQRVEKLLSQLPGSGPVESYLCDLSSLSDVKALAVSITSKHSKIDVLINNAGVYKIATAINKDGLDLRFVVNTLAPYLLTQGLLPVLGKTARVVNLSSAAQAPVSLEALRGHERLSESQAYAQSKLALTMWSRQLALALKETGPAIIAVNPASLLGSKMVKEAYGIAGGDLSIGADILYRAALADEFADASGLYFDNDAGCFAAPHADALDSQKTARLVTVIEQILSEKA